MGDEIDRTMQRVRRYWFEDGLAEMAIGFVSVLVGLIFFVEALAPPGLLPDSFSAFALPIVLVVGGWIAGQLLKAAKARLTHPRTGYVAYRGATGRRRIVTAAAAFALAVLAAGLLRLEAFSPNWLATSEGLLFAAGLLYLGHSLGLARFYLLALLSALIGAATLLGNTGDVLGSAVLFAGLGVAMVASGAWALRSYLKQTQPPTTEV